MLQSLATRKQVKLLEKKARVTPERSFEAFKAAIEAHKSKLIEKGIIDKYTGEIDFKKLKLELKRDKDFAKDFYSTVAEKVGFSGDKLVVGKAVTNVSIRAGLAAKGLGGKGLTALSASEIAKLNEFGNHLAKKFGGGSFSQFVTRYNTDEKFRNAVNDYITKVVNKDPSLAGLKGYKPEEIVGGITAVKAITMSRTDTLRDALKPTGRQTIKNLVVYGGMASMTMGSMYITQASVMPLTANPHLSQSVYMTYYGTMEALKATSGTLSPFYLRDAARQVQNMQQQQQMMG